MLNVHPRMCQVGVLACECECKYMNFKLNYHKARSESETFGTIFALNGPQPGAYYFSSSAFGLSMTDLLQLVEVS